MEPEPPLQMAALSLPGPPLKKPAGDALSKRAVSILERVADEASPE
jgi:hypothetical protein